MKVLTVLTISIAIAFSVPVQENRVYFPEENDPDFKRFIYIENQNGELELIDLRTPDISPRAITALDVEYDIYTLKNKATPQTIKNNSIAAIKQSNFDPKKLTVMVCHGWNNNRGSAVNTKIRTALQSVNLDVNLFIIDWSGIANKLYITAQGSVVAIGKIVGDLINSIQATYGLNGSSFVLIGHSLGAHVMGSAGATSKNKVHHIIGLDPAGPLFWMNKPDERLDVTDAEMVQVIHTNGDLLGFASAIGHVDYYPNGGMGQPGCGLDLAGTCAHGRSYAYLAEAITRGPVFEGLLCSDYGKFQKGGCTGNEMSAMGQIAVPTCSNGDYFLKTNDKEPYGLS